MASYKVYGKYGYEASYTNIDAANSHVEYLWNKYKQRGYVKFGSKRINSKNVPSRKSPRKTQGTKVKGRLTFSNPTNSGKGTVKGYVSGRRGQNSKSTVVKRTSYKTRSGQRRVLEIVTTKKVIKAVGRSKRRRY